MKKELYISLVVAVIWTSLLLAQGGWGWHDAAPMNTARAQHIGAVVDGRIYVFGGRTFDGRRYVPLSSVEVFEPDSNRWVEREPMPYPLYQAGIATIGRYIYIFGGMIENNGHPIDSVMVYDTERDLFRVVDRMPEARYAMGAVSVGRSIIVMGGIRLNGIRREDVNTGFWYDPTHNEWQDAPPLPTRRSNFGMTFGPQTVWVVGGLPPTNRVTHLLGERWREMEPLPIGCGAPGTVFLHDTLVVAGGMGRGQNQSGILRSVFGCHPEDNSWMRMPEMAQARSSFVFVELDDTLFAIGGLGHPGNGRNVVILDAVEKYNYIEPDCVYTPLDPPETMNHTVAALLNPTNGVIRFHLPQKSVTIRIINITGRIVIDKAIQGGGIWAWNSRNHPAGTYLYVITSMLGQSRYTGKFVVIK
ncbi:MAG: kelch repeat-containing protein [Candidatus Electryoneaceae bacterium]|nr:kelch repeat-containing protein [Candidatus Electryoneaceae bacterium]